MINFLTIVLFNIASTALAQTPKTCGTNVPHLVPLDKPIDGKTFKPDLGTESTFYIRKDNKMLPIRYSKYKATVAPQKGTVLFLCGGPGVPCTGMRPQSVPSDFDVVTLDYLGLGQNKLHNKPKLMAIESQGSVVAELARNLNEPNLIIYVESFGTTVGTVAASEISNANPKGTKTQLKGIILEGVVGPNSGMSYSDGYVDASKTAWDLLTPAEQTNFKKKYFEAIKGLTPEQKQNVDSTIVMNIQSGTDSVVQFLKTIEPSFIRFTASSNAYTNFITKPEVREIFRSAGCQLNLHDSKNGERQKIFGDTVAVVTIADGLEQVCRCKTVERSYNPNSHQITAPIIYINGGQDPATPLAGAKAHMNGQTKSDFKILISKAQGGHFDSFPSLKECMPQFFESFTSNRISELKANQDKISRYGCAVQKQEARSQNSTR